METITEYDDRNPLLRQAIWEAHRGKCFYTGDPVPLPHIQMDHIIPKSLKKSNPSKLKSLLHELDLPQDYSLDSLTNILPVRSHLNNLKRNRLRGGASIRALQESAKDKLAEIHKCYARLLNDNVDFPGAFPAAYKAVQDGRFSAESIHDMLTGESALFEDGFSLRKEDRKCILSASRVRIDCFLPVGRNLQPGCMLILLRRLQVRGCAITVEHAEIMEKLFRETDAADARQGHGYILATDEKTRGSIVQFSRCSLVLDSEVTQQLRDLLDRLRPLYLSAMEEDARAAGADFFSASPGHLDSYRLLRVSGELCENIFRAALSGDGFVVGSWKVSANSSTRLAVRSGGGREGIRFQAFLYPEYGDGTAWTQRCKQQGEPVWLCWRLEDHICVTEKLGRLVGVEAKAADVYRWLVEELIPFWEQFPGRSRVGGLIHLLLRSRRRRMFETKSGLQEAS